MAATVRLGGREERAVKVKYPSKNSKQCLFEVPHHRTCGLEWARDLSNFMGSWIDKGLLSDRNVWRSWPQMSRGMGEKAAGSKKGKGKEK